MAADLSNTSRSNGPAYFTGELLNTKQNGSDCQQAIYYDTLPATAAILFYCIRMKVVQQLNRPT